MRHNTEDPDLSGRIGDRRDHAVPATAASTTTTAPAYGELFGRIDRPGGYGLSASASAATAPGAPFR